MRFILSHLKNYKLLLFLNMIAVLGFVLTELAIPSIMSTMIDTGLKLQDQQYILNWGYVLLAIALFGGLSSILLAYTSTRISTNITRDIRNQLFSHVQTLAHEDFNQFGVSSMITRTTSDPYQLQLFVQLLLRLALMTPIMILSSIILIVQTNLTLSSVMAISIPVIVIGVIVIAKMSAPLSEKQQTLLDKINRIVRENITGVRVIRSFQKDEYESNRFEEGNQEYRKVSQKLFKLMSFTDPVFFFFLNAMLALVTWIASHMIQNGLLNVGQLVAFGEYQFHAMFSMMLFAMVFVMYPRASVSAKRIEEVLNVQPSIVSPENGLILNQGVSTLEFKSVNFHYPDGEANVLDDLNFKVKKGETIAFIGSTGSGKSTLAKLLVRLYDVTGGSILLDNHDVRNLDLHNLRDLVSFALQKALLFSGSIKENIQFGYQPATEEAVVESSKQAEAYQFIQKKPQQFEDAIEEGGANVSGGQRQRLSIARTLIKPAGIYVFDDSFSALDYKTDALIRQNLKSVQQDSIIMIIAQRVSSITHADQIVVLHEGKIVGQGKHEDLLSTCEIYREIAFSQLSQEELSQYENVNH